ncbi:hypothetical protein [Streptomonospora litoralis]|uniref:Uncharacterized protein n=1 Tax=Streptomonospora litoralis TaxID=2498135 RepID=A0A4P6Q180_9ACTN|nr:hypothetical protein [Streptomonospora litoralis]QBI54328.1 hypothetical protein EKD16_12730 [Streptomonospora litoralis]
MPATAHDMAIELRHNRPHPAATPLGAPVPTEERERLAARTDTERLDDCPDKAVPVGAADDPSD